jgi:hypothetical protein
MSQAARKKSEFASSQPVQLVKPEEPGSGADDPPSQASMILSEATTAATAIRINAQEQAAQIIGKAEEVRRSADSLSASLIDQAEMSRNKVDAYCREAMAKAEQAQITLSELDAKATGLRAESERLQIHVQQAESESRALADQKQALESDIQHLSRELARLSELRSSDRTEEKIELLKQELDGLRAEYSEVRAQIEHDRNELAWEIQTARAELEAQSTELRLKKSQLQIEIMEIQGKKAVVERELAIAEVERESSRRKGLAHEQSATETRREAEKALQDLRSAKTSILLAKSRLQALTEHSASLERTIAQQQRVMDGLIEMSSQMESRIESEISQYKEEARIELEGHRAEAERHAAETRQRADAEAQRIIERSEAEFKRLLAAAQEERDKLIAEGQSQTQALQAQAEERARKVIADAEAQAGIQRLAAQQEISELRRAAELEMSRHRSMELANLEERKSKETSESLARRRQDVDQISKNVEQAFAAYFSRITGTPGKEGSSVELDSSFIRRCLEDVDGVVRQTLMPDKTAATVERFRSFMPFDPKAQEKSKKFWIRAGAGILAAVLFIVVGLAFPGLYSSLANGIVSLFKPTQSASDLYVKEVQAERVRKKFDPPQDTVFRSTYVENVLYTKDYARLKEDEELSKKWVLELNHFLVRDLGLSDRVIVAYIPEENSLVRELIKLRGLINPNYEREGIQRMEQAEAPVVPGLRALVGGDQNFAKVQEFQKAFYHKWIASPSVVDSASSVPSRSSPPAEAGAPATQQ